jgi:hypothetical protein
MLIAPDSLPSPKLLEWLAESQFPDYSGGTMPDFHRLPFYALAGTQNLHPKSSTSLKRVVSSCWKQSEHPA